MLCAACSPLSEDNLTNYVNPFIGTDGPGNTYPGATVPFGMVQLSPDNGLEGWDRIAGYYWQDSTIAGFSHTHLTGTGAGDMYDILLMPLNSRFNKDLWPDHEDYRPYSMFSHENEEAMPGYYKVKLLSSGIVAELSATKRAGFHKYTFPEDDSSKIILDLGYRLNWDNPVNTFIHVEDSQTISGYRLSTGWAKDQRVYFVAKFSKPFNSFTLFKNNQKTFGDTVNSDKTKFTAHYSTTENDIILVKVGISTSSIEGAKYNLQSEIPHWKFKKTVKEATENWVSFLSSIKIKGTNYQKEVFYSNLYHCFLTPNLHSDIDGQYKGADGKNKTAEGFTRYDLFSLWDTYRTAHPLYTILYPNYVKNFIQSFLAHYDETGELPVWSMAGNETYMMIGYHAVPVIVDAYFKGIEMDAEKAYEACKVSATIPKRGIDEYLKYGYIPYDSEKNYHWNVSKTMEYAYDDWCIAQFAKALNKTDDYNYFLKRADNWKNLYDSVSTFIRPKAKNGEFLESFIPKEYTEYYCESNAWHYFWHVQHDIEGLIDIIGKDKFADKLDSMFTYYPEPDDKLPIFSTGMIGQYAHGNEPSHHVAYLFNYIDKPYRTQELVRKIIETQYSNKPNGYCGNEDCGQMSAWLVMSAMGLYPVNPADGIYHLTSPWIEEAEITFPNAKKLTIIAKNQSAENKYIQSVRWNGESYNQLTISHKQIMQGGELTFILGNQIQKSKHH